MRYSIYRENEPSFELKANIFQVSSRHGIRNVIIDVQENEYIIVLHALRTGRRIPPAKLDTKFNMATILEPAESTNIKPLRLSLTVSPIVNSFVVKVTYVRDDLLTRNFRVAARGGGRNCDAQDTVG